jgi:hypothetical protein
MATMPSIHRRRLRLVLASICFFAAATTLLFSTTVGVLVGSAMLMARPSRNPVQVLKPRTAVKAPLTDQEIAAEVAELTIRVERGYKMRDLENKRLAAVIRLGEIGPRARAAVPVLQKFTKRKDPAESNAAKAAIASITGPPRKHWLVSWLFP